MEVEVAYAPVCDAKGPVELKPDGVTEHVDLREAARQAASIAHFCATLLPFTRECPKFEAGNTKHLLFLETTRMETCPFCSGCLRLRENQDANGAVMDE